VPSNPTLPQYQIRCLFPHHNAGRIQVAVGDAGEDGAVGDAEVLDADDAALWVDHGEGVVSAADAGGAAGVESAFGVLNDEAVEFVIGL